MQDTDFERLSERAKLLTNDGYFARHRELAAEHGVLIAWEMVEKELPLGIQRYSSFFAFENAKKRFIDGTLNEVVFLKFSER